MSRRGGGRRDPRGCGAKAARRGAPLEEARTESPHAGDAESSQIGHQRPSRGPSTTLRIIGIIRVST
eukprot:scaffold215896_cov30-Tisochrysis_lutea.AAC.1